MTPKARSTHGTLRATPAGAGGVSAIAVLLAVAVLAGGCGTGSGEGAAATDPPRPATTAPAPPPAESELRAFATGLLADTGAQGGIVAYTRGGGAPVVATVGTQPADDGGPAAPVAADSSLSVASITKSYVAALALILAAEGRVDLDAPLSRWLDWPGGDQLTLRHLLDQTSGLGDFEETLPFVGLIARGTPVAVDEALAAARDTPPVAPPGAGTHYSNLNYLVAGAVLEAATGEDVRALLHTRVFGPLQLDQTWYPPARAGDDAPVPGLSEPGPDRAPVSTRTLPMDAWQTVVGPASGAVSTVEDLLAWSSAVLRQKSIGGTDVSAMTRIGPGGYGLGVIGVDADGDCVFDGCPPDATFPRWALNGDIPGSSTRLWHDPTADATLFVYLNRDDLSLDEPMLRLLDDLVDR